MNNEKENESHFIDGYFHTRDLAVYENGHYILKGRKDDMIKINGNRIEPSEIEAVCQKRFDLKQCVAKGFQSQGTVVLYYVDNKDIDLQKAREKLEDVLPYYMIPTYFVKLDRIPLNKSGKIDRKALIFPIEQAREPYVAPRNKTEKKLKEAIEKVLDITNVGIDDDFFSLGGNSIKAIEVVDFLEKRSIKNGITSSLIYEGRTIRKIFDAYTKQKKGLTSEEKELLGREKKIPLSHVSLTLYTPIKYFPEATALNLFGGMRYKKRPLFTGNKLCNAVNETIRYNSQLLTVIKEDENGNPYWVYAPECYPEIEVEKMNDQEAMRVADTFVHGFGASLDKKLYRIRIIESPKYIYVYADFSHVLIDGFTLELLLQDFVSAYFGKVNKENRFYEWLYDTEALFKSEDYWQCEQYFNDRYLPYVDNMHFIDKGGEGDQYIKKVYPLNFDVAILKEHRKIYKVTNSIFLNTVCICALAIFNERKDTGIEWLYNGLDGRKNHCSSNKVHSLLLALFKEEYLSLEELYAEINEQVYEGIKRGRFFVDYDGEFARNKNKYQNLVLDYIADLESGFDLQKFGGERLELANPHDADLTLGFLALQIMDTPNGMDMRLWHSVSILSEENAKVFVEIIRDVIATILSGNVPSFLQKKE